MIPLNFKITSHFMHTARSTKACVEQPAGGSWEAREPSFKRSVKALFRRTWLLKIRDAGTIVSEIIATILIAILAILWNFGTKTHDAEPSPAIGSYNLLWGGSESPAMVSLFNKDLVLGRGGNWVAAPNNDKVKQMINQYYGYTPIPIVDTKHPEDTSKYVMVNFAEKYWKYVDDKKGIEESFDSVDAFSNAIQWVNAPDSDDDKEWMTNMSIVLYENQNLIMFFAENAKCAATMAYAGSGLYRASVAEGIQQQFRTTLGNDAFELKGFNTGIFSTPSIYQQIFARPKVENEIPINIAVAFFAAIPIVIASMPDLTLILTDKDTHIMTFTFLMGASEPSYWLVSFVATFCMCLIPYIVMDILLCFVMVMNGTSFTLLLVLNILFIIAYINFQAFLSTFFKTASSGRVLTVVFLILIVFFGYLNEVYTLDANDAVKHVLSLFPIESYQMMISVMYEEVRNKRHPIGWSEFGDNGYKYPVYYCFIWQIADSIIFFLLFLFTNATLDRGFGAPLIRFRDLFHCKFPKQKQIELDDLTEEDNIIEVRNLVKRYNGKSVDAVDDVSFSIKKNEIIVMIGPNGAGKSSIINTISGAIPSTSGQLILGNGEPLELFSGIQNCLGIVFQDNVIMKLLSIREHLEIYGAIRGIDDVTLQEAIDFFAETLQLQEMLPNRAGDLSGGQKRKLCTALALLGNPPIIIMDEPTAGVDVQARQLIWKTISNLKNSTCIITTHALEEAEAVSSRLFVVSRGKIPFAGTSSELRNEFKCGYILKVDCEEEALQGILEVAQSFEPGAKILPEHDNTIALPVSSKIPQMLSTLDSKKEQLGYEDYSFSVEQLEDVLLRILETS